MAACFSEPPPVADDGATTTDECPVGAAQCPCTSGGSCDTPYVCHEPSQTCIEQTCDPGTEFCTCNEGTCSDGHECIDDLCMPSPATTGAVTGTSGTTTSVESTSDPTEASQGTIPSDTSSDDASETTTMDGVCEACLEQSAPAECAGTFGSCAGNEDCLAFSNCVFRMYSIEACCLQWMPTDAWLAFAMCATNPDLGQCADECADQQLHC